MIRLHLDQIEYEWNEEDEFTKDDRTYSFASLKKVTTYKGNKKYQNLTVKPEHIEMFMGFLRDIIDGKQSKQSSKDEEDAPF